VRLADRPGERSERSNQSLSATISNPARGGQITWDAFDIKLMKILGICLGVILVVSTYLHFWVPGLLRVPQTPVPDNTFWNMLFMEVLTLVMSFLCGMHCYRTFGPYATMLFFVGSFVFTGTMENLMILSGRFGLIPFESYYFNKGGLTLYFEVPVSVCLGWFVLAYSSVYIAGLIFQKTGPVARAAIASFICMDIDLWSDPVMTHPNNMFWTWLQDRSATTHVFSIPLYNFVAWFGIIFLFEVLWLKAQRWHETIGKNRATVRFFLWIFAMMAFYLATVVGMELLIRATLPKVNFTIGGI
jgi:hypothetical protein